MRYRGVGESEEQGRRPLLFLSGIGRSGEEAWSSLEDAGCKDNAGAAVVERNGKGKDAPTGTGTVFRSKKEQATAGAVDVRFASLRDGTEDFRPIHGD
jgi:hypothetical protein